MCRHATTGDHQAKLVFLLRAGPARQEGQRFLALLHRLPGHKQPHRLGQVPHSGGGGINRRAPRHGVLHQAGFAFALPPSSDASP
jgi:hypothetical protein